MEPQKILKPKFLTDAIAARATDVVLSATLLNPLFADTFDGTAHIVMLVPSMKDERDDHYPNWPNYTVEPHSLFERSIGTQKAGGWKYPLAGIAQCKALQLWHDRNDDRTDIMPHLLFPGDTPYWGGVKRHGIVVTCSGEKPHFDKMVSGMIADMAVGLAYDAWEVSDDRKSEVNFLA